MSNEESINKISNYIPYIEQQTINPLEKQRNIYNTKPTSFIGVGNTLKDELIIRSIKIIDIAYVSVLLFCLGFIVSVFLDYLYIKLFGKFDEKKAKKKSRIIIIIESIIHFAIIGILIYIFRNIVEYIPFPLHGVHKYNHYRLKELTSASLFITILLIFQSNLQAKLVYLKNSVSGTNNKNTSNTGNLLSFIFGSSVRI